MYKFLSICLFAALFVSASAFTANPSKAGEKKPETILTVDLTQTGAGTATGTWTASAPGPYMVSLVNLTTGQRIQQFSTMNTTAVFTNLTKSTKYRLTVGDVNLVSDDELITF